MEFWELKRLEIRSWMMEEGSLWCPYTNSHSPASFLPTYKIIPPSMRISVPVIKLATLLSDK